VGCQKAKFLDIDTLCVKAQQQGAVTFWLEEKIRDGGPITATVLEQVEALTYDETA